MEYVLDNGIIRVALSSMGAEMQSIRKDGTEYLWQGDPKYWPRKAPVLFPSVGRITKETYSYDGKVYKMQIHGFARKSEFHLERAESSSTKAFFYLEDNEGTRNQYPCRFQLGIIYELVNNIIRITYRIVNRDTREMHFGIGGHPGFRVPLELGLNFEDYYLEFCREGLPDRIGHSEDLFLNGKNMPYALEGGKRLPLTHGLFNEDAVVLQNMSRQVTLKSKKASRSVTVCYPEMRYLGIWHKPYSDAPYVCIEPWTSLPSRKNVIEEFSQRSDMIHLGGGRSYCNQWAIGIN